MNKHLMVLLGASLLSTSALASNHTAASSAAGQSTKGLTTEMDRISYALGAEMGSSFKRQQITVDAKQFTRGLQDALQGRNLQLNKAQLKQAVVSLQTQMKMRYIQRAQANAQAGQQFLAKNKKQKGVVELASGLQYKVIKSGTGTSPAATDTVTVTYKGTHLDGRVFDSTDKTGKPATFGVNQVISGWSEALKLMKPGATWQLYIPSKLAYGPRGRGPAIGPNETLLFRVHLISVKAAANARPKA